MEISSHHLASHAATSHAARRTPHARTALTEAHARPHTPYCHTDTTQLRALLSAEAHYLLSFRVRYDSCVALPVPWALPSPSTLHLDLLSPSRTHAAHGCRVKP
jgi:hypothetical protein